MADSKGYQTYDRAPASPRPVRERVGDWAEVIAPRSTEQARQQGARCQSCGIPFCHQGCPLGNEIPDWNEMIARDDWRSAWRMLQATNELPEMTGRLCPAPCEAACTLAIHHGAVTIEHNERDITERAFGEGWVAIPRGRRRTGKSVGVVGSGPAGLSAAQFLRRAGHAVTVYEAADRPGGLLRYGIPDFKLDKRVVDRRIALMERAGIQFQTNTRVGTDLTWGEVQEQHDAVIVAIGATQPRDLPVAGRELQGVHFAMDFLAPQNRRVAGDAEQGDPAIGPWVQGEHVVVIGGGDTGADCVGTAHRQGAASVTQIELFPEPPGERPSDNPWPRWPKTLRTSTSHVEGGTREWALMTREIVGTEGRVTGLLADKVEVHFEGGRPVFTPVGEVTLPADRVLLAMGFTNPVAESLSKQLGVELNRRGNIAVDKQFRTNIPNLYAAGDAQRGASLIVWAIADGREAARCVDAELMGEERLTALGEAAPFE